MCELLDTEPKTQCKVCLSYWDIGIVYCTCGHFLRKGIEENKKFVQYTMGLLCIPDYFFKERATNPSTVTGRSQGTENTTSPIHSRRSATRRTFWASCRFIRDEKFRKNMIDKGRTEICRQMFDLVDENHTHHLTPEEIDDYRSNWWIRSNKN